MLFPDQVITIIGTRLDSLYEALVEEADFRKCLAKIPLAAFPLRGLADLSDNPDILFTSWLIVQMLFYVQTAYEGHSSAWYEFNRENIDEFRLHLLTFISGLREHIKTDDANLIIADVKEFFRHFNLLARQLTGEIK